MTLVNHQPAHVLPTMDGPEAQAALNHKSDTKIRRPTGSQTMEATYQTQQRGHA